MKKEICNKLLLHIEGMTNEIIQLTRSMIQIPSVNPPGSYVNISNFLIKFLQEIGLYVEIIEAPNNILNSYELKAPRPNIIGTYATGCPGPILILNGHQDVVPPGSGWTVNPFSGIIKNGKIFGRGASDMKGTIAAMIMAIKAIKELDVDLKGEVKIIICVDEETGGSLGAKYVVEKTGLRGDYCISEGPVDRIIRAWNGAWWFKLTTYGKSAHGSVPWAGINAIEKMATFISGLNRLQDDLKDKTSYIPGISYGTFNFGSIHGGKEANTVCSSCMLSVDRRVVPEETLATAKNQVNKLLNVLSKEDSELQFDLETIFQTNPCILPKKHPLVTTVNKSAELVSNKELKVMGQTSFNDGRFFMEKGIPTIGFGAPGRGGEASIHGPDEYIEINNLILATKTYALTICNLLSP